MSKCPVCSEAQVSVTHLSGARDLEDLHGARDDVLHGLLPDAAQVDGRDFPQSALWRHPGLLLLLRGHDRQTRAQALLRERSRHLQRALLSALAALISLFMNGRSTELIQRFSNFV